MKLIKTQSDDFSSFKLRVNTGNTYSFNDANNPKRIPDNYIEEIFSDLYSASSFEKIIRKFD